MSRQGRRSLRPENADECGAGAAWSNDSGTSGPPGGNTSRGRASSSFSPFQLEPQAAVVDAAPVGGVHVVASQANRAWIAARRSPRVAVSGIFTLRQDGGFCRHPSPRSGHGHPRPKCAYSLAINPGATDGKHAASQHGHHGRFAKKCYNHNTGLPTPFGLFVQLIQQFLRTSVRSAGMTSGAMRPRRCRTASARVPRESPAGRRSRRDIVDGLAVGPVVSIAPIL